MKSLSATMVILCMAIVLSGQPPQAFKYQTVVRDNTGQIIVSQPVDLRFSIHDFAPTGTIVYQETHTVTTNQFGLVNLEIGKGSNPIGSFILIDWSSGSKFLEIELDLFGGGTAYSSMGTAELLSVPFALHAQSASVAEDNDWTISGNDMYSNVSGNIGIGETAPSHKLTVNGGNARILGSNGWTSPGHTADLYLGDPNYGIRAVESEGLRIWAYDDFATDIRFQDHLGTDLMTIDMYWKSVGIGTTDPHMGKLQVEGGSFPGIYVSSDDYTAFEAWSSAGGGYAAGIFHATGPGTYGITVSSQYESINTYAHSNSAIAIRATASDGAFAGVFEGNVGIGTLLPLNAKLEIEGGSLPALKATSDNSNTIHASANAGGGYAAGFFEATNPGTYGLWTQSDDYDALYAYTSSPTHAAIRATGGTGAYAGIFNGNVGIGTNNPTNGLLEVEGGGNTAIYASSNNLNTIQSLCNAGGGYAAGFFGASNPGTYGIWVQSDDYDALYAYTSSPSNAAIRAVAGSAAYAGIFDGSVGIGTDTPVGKLHVVSSENYPGYFETSFTSTESHTLHAKYTGGTADAIAVYGESIPTDFFGYGGHFTGGYVGVAGTVEPVGASTYFGVTGQAFGGSGTNYGIYGAAGGTGTNYAGYFMGDVTVTGTFTNPSDIKLKKNIQPLANMLAKIELIDVHSFEFKTDGDAQYFNLSKTKQIGFIAQEMEQIFPELVTHQVHAVDRNLGNKGVTKDILTINYKGINYIGMIPVLTQAIKEQQEIIEDLMLRIERLENK